MFNLLGRFNLVGGAENVLPEEIKKEQDEGKKIVILDVREPWEYQTARVEGSVLIPLGQLEKRKDELDPTAEIATLCHKGVRSYQAMMILKSLGFKNIRNISGGIDAWSVRVDPAVPRYR